MPEISEAIKLWVAALFYGILVTLYLIKECFIKGVRAVFPNKKWDRPKILDDPGFGMHGFLALKDDIRIHYIASGPEDKPLLLFVHGFPDFWYTWRNQIKEFQKNYRVVAIDMRGYSESSKPAGINNYSVVKLMSDLEQVINALGYKSCILVAHDWGGAVAWAFGRHYSQLVAKLIIMNAPPKPIFMKLLQTNKQQMKKSWYIFFFQLPWLPELALQSNDYSVFHELLGSGSKENPPADEKGSKENPPADEKGSKENPPADEKGSKENPPADEKGSKENPPADEKEKEDEHITPYKYTFSQPGATTPPINYYRALFRSIPGEKNDDYDLEYTMPVLLIWGCKDVTLGTDIPDEIEKVAPKIEVKRIPDVAHFVQTNAPDEVNKIMKEWLSKH